MRDERMRERLDDDLNTRAQLAFVELPSRLRDLVHDCGLHRTPDRDHFFDSIDNTLAPSTRSGPKGRSGSGIAP